MRNAADWKKLIPIIEAINAGQVVQYKKKAGSTWYVLDPNLPIGFGEENEYRIKPQVLQYRRYLYNLGKFKCVGSISNNEVCTTPKSLEKEFYFIKWIDTEWQEYELPTDAASLG